MSLENFITLLGGVSLFLFGMSLMGDGLKNVAGNKLEVFLYKLTGTPVKGILLGTGVTAVIQSSSAVSIMAVGFVNSSMMTLKQAISIIMGAIVGTSVTGWIISISQLGNSGALNLLSTQSISGFCAIIGILIKLFAKKKATKKSSDIILGFAILMFGMKSMSESVEVLHSNPAFINILTKFNSPFICIIVGMIITAILQSSSATVGILQGLSATGVISFEIALPTILGISIGACVPVLLSSVNSNTNGKRTALSYPIIEIIRVLLFGTVFYTFNAIFDFSFMQKSVGMVDIALINSLFRLSTILVLSPFISYLEQLTCLLIKENPETEKNLTEIKLLENKFLSYPSLAVEQTRLAINSMAEKAKNNVSQGLELLFDYNEDLFDETNNLEDIIDKYEDKIGTYLMQLTEHDLNKSQSSSVNKYLHSITDFERISDHALNLAESAKEIHEKKIAFSSDAVHDIKCITGAVSEVIKITTKSFVEDNEELARRIEPLEQTIDSLCLQIKNKHIERMQKGLCSLLDSYIFNDLMTNFERISDHCSNIGMTILGLKENNLASHEYGNKLKSNNQVFKTLFKEYKEKYKL